MTVEDVLKIIEVAKFTSVELDSLGQAIMKKSNVEQVGDLVQVYFPIINKNQDLEYNDEWIAKESEECTCKIMKILDVDDDYYTNLGNSLLDANTCWDKIGGASIDDKYLEGIKEGSKEYYAAWKMFGVTNVVKVTNGRESFYVNSEGYDYARYVGRAIV